jgi:predicted transcriptional regulator
VHFTLRLSTGTSERLERRARALGTAPRTLAARYIEEGVRRDDHPLVHFVDGETGRRAALLGTHLDVWEVIATVRDNANDVIEAAEYLGVPAGVVEAAVTYYGEFRDEIEAEIALNDVESERALAAHRRGQAALGA